MDAFTEVNFASPSFTVAGGNARLRIDTNPSAPVAYEHSTNSSNGLTYYAASNRGGIDAGGVQVDEEKGNGDGLTYCVIA